YQFAKLQNAAEKNGWTKFVSMQNHYNLLYREDEREMIPICKEQGVVLTPYSPLAAGRLSRAWSAETLRSKTDATAKGKYDSTKDTDMEIVNRLAETAKNHDATMSQIALAWHFAKGITAPLIGATKAKYFDDAAESFSVKLTPEEVLFLEEPYVPHKIVGAV
ncbi:MAG: aldo/keto reductase, partial [Ruthenibacterium sp.]